MKKSELKERARQVAVLEHQLKELTDPDEIKEVERQIVLLTDIDDIGLDDFFRLNEMIEKAYHKMYD